MSVINSGKILKIFNNLYEVFDFKSLNIQVCYKQKKVQKIAVGDEVTFDNEGAKGNILEVKPRKNLLSHPCVANVDMIFYVVALTNPEYQFFQIDWFLAYLTSLNIKAKLIFTKKDLVQKAEIEKLKLYSSLGFETFFLNALDLEAEEKAEIYKQMKNKTVVFVGGSGVGKSTLLKQLCMDTRIIIDEVSLKTLKGKQTTKQVSLYYLDLYKTFVADTPGFSLFDDNLFRQIDPGKGFPEFHQYAVKCRFSDCTHQEEPDCCVKQAVEKEQIKKTRYDSYMMLNRQLEKIRKRCDY